MKENMKPHNDNFELYDIKVTTIRCTKGKKLICNHPVGSYFIVSGENLQLPSKQTFPIYPLAALLPLIPAKQRHTHPNDWLSTDQEVACPDPHCGGIFQIERISKKIFKHSEVTAVPLKKENHA